MRKLLSERERKILFVTLAVIILYPVFNLFLSGAFTKNNDLNKEINLNRVKLRKYLTLLSQKDVIRKRYEKFTSGIKIAGEQADTLVNALAELEGLAKNSDIKIIDLRPQAAKNLGLYREIIIDMRSEGTMEAHLNFIYNLEKSLTYLKIKKIQLTAGPNSQLLEGTLSISHISD